MTHIEKAKQVFDIEIEGLNFVKNNLDENFNKAVDTILNSEGRVVITGMGKSGIVGKKIAATMASTGTRAFFMHPGEAYHGDLGMIGPQDIILAISNSGETEELIKLISFFQENKNFVIAMTGKKDSTLAKYTDLFLNIGIEKEACPLELAPTTSTTVTMTMGDALSIALMKARDFKEEHFAKFHPGGSLGKKLLMKVKDVMKTKDLPVLSLDKTFTETISIISNGRLGVGVIIENEKVLGVITDGDIRRLLEKEKARAIDLFAKDFFTKNPKSVDADEKVAKAEQIMQDTKITTLIVKENDKFVGILHRYDL